MGVKAKQVEQPSARGPGAQDHPGDDRGQEHHRCRGTHAHDSEFFSAVKASGMSKTAR